MIKTKIYSKRYFCPAFDGSGDTLDVVKNQYFPISSILYSDIISEFIMPTPVISALFLIRAVFGDNTIIKGPIGETCKLSEIGNS
jgi:hypothetical protein